MANERASTYRALYRRLLALYPAAFRERFSEPMEQTFVDLCNQRPGNLLSIFADTGAGLAREHVLQFVQGKTMNDTITNPKLAAIITVFLSLPFLVSSAIAVLEIEPLLSSFKALTSVDGQQLNGVGRLIIFGGVFLLPVAFFVNLSSMFTKRAVEKKIAFRPRLTNLVIGCAVLSMMVFVGAFVIGETINCSRGVCD